MSSAKVVGIHGGNAGISGGNVKPLPMPLVKLRELFKQKVHTLLRGLFDGADDALFAMADKAGSNNEQTVYFDAMRELRLQKKTIATHVIKGVIQSFNEIGHYYAPKDTSAQGDTALDDLSLIQNDDLEINVAVEGMINRIRSTSGQVLDELHLRTGSLIEPMTIRHEQMPASPEILCDVFIEGCADLEINIRARLVVLKLYEKFVLEKMQQVYADANALFIQLGIAPDIRKLKQTPRHSQANVQSPPTGAQKPQSTVQTHHGIPAEPSEGGGQVLCPDETFGMMAPQSGQFEGLRQLLHQGDSTAQPVNSGEVPTLSNVYYSHGEIIGALTGFQSEHIDQLGNSNMHQVLDFRSLLDQRLAQGECQADYSELDNDVINLVSMLFEFILEDRQLQPAMKALLARLQIPILKVAIIDKNFFNKGGHPARKLLNEMATAAIGWNEVAEGKKDRLKEKLESVVERVLNDFEQDLGLFDALLEEFCQFVDLEKRRGQLVEQRTKDSENGKAANDQAKQAVQESLNDSIRHYDVPQYIRDFLEDGWSAVMVLHFLKEGEQGEKWLDACQLVDELLWSIEPCTEEADARTKLLKAIPRVMKRLREGLKDISYDDFKAKALFKELEDSHVAALQRLQASQLEEIQEQLTAPVQAEDEHSLEEQDDAVSDLIQSTMELEADFGDRLNEAVETASEVASDHEAAESAEAEDANEEIVLVSVEPDANSAQIDESDPFVQQVDKFAVGCWFEFQNGGNVERCKLAAIIKSTGKYIFVNRSGVKVAEKTRMGLAVELRRGSVQMLNDGLLFDRALESIITNLRGKGA